MKVLFRNTNLIGDALEAIPVMEAIVNATVRKFDLIHFGFIRIVFDSVAPIQIDIAVEPHLRDLFRCVNFQCRIVSDEELAAETYDFEYVFDVGKAFAIAEREKCHIVDAYAKLLNVSEYQYKIHLNVPEQPVPKDLVLIAPFSKSCSSNEGRPPNKMLPPAYWKPLIKYLSTLGEVKVLGSKTDRLDGVGLSEDQYLAGLPLTEIAVILRHCKVLVTIDNGIAHLAASQDAPMLLFYPACLGTHWIVPRGNDNMGMIQIDPATIQPAYLSWAVKTSVPSLIDYSERYRHDNT